MSLCKGLNKNGSNCKRYISTDYCYNHKKYKYNQKIYISSLCNDEINNVNTYYNGINNINYTCHTINQCIKGIGSSLLNFALSKQICIDHINGSGRFNPKRTTYWQNIKPPKYNIKIYDNNNIKVNNIIYNKIEWLDEHEDEWYSEWKCWSEAISNSGNNGYHWLNTNIIVYRYCGEYLNFRDWKKFCYIERSYLQLPKINIYWLLEDIWDNNETIRINYIENINISNTLNEKCITKDYIRYLYNHSTKIPPISYVMTGLLLDVNI